MKCFKFIGVMSLLFFSFFLTDFVTELAINNNPLMQSIKNNSDNYLVGSVNAVIDNNTIIPGIKGKKVNDMESYLNMKDFGVFNINYLVYDSFLPDISLEDNKDKVIISGNKLKRNVSILIKDNKDVIKYSDDNNILYSKLVRKESVLNYKENINIESNNKRFNDLDILLNKNDLNRNICILGFSNLNECKNKEYYLVDITFEYNNSNYSNILNNVSNGNIILIDDSLSVNNFKILLDYLNSKDINVLYLSELIKE